MVDIDGSYLIKKKQIDLQDTRFNQTGSMLKGNDDIISTLYAGNGYAHLDSALTSTIYGIDIFGTGSPAQQTHEQFGLTFFTRPMLNLSYDNITVDRTLNPLGTLEPLSIGRYVRAMLDPLGNYNCPLVDQTNIFLPLLSNTCESLSGWQDPIIDTYQSPSGIKKESWSIADSSNKVYQVMQLSSSFRNTRGNILGYMFHVWQTYMGLMYEGVVDPYPSFIRHFTIDYQTRIYRLILDNTRTYVQEIVMCGAAFPLANNAGSRANYNRTQVLNQEVDTYSQTWQAMGAFYYDTGAMYDFNEASSLLKPDFANPRERMKRYRRLWPSEYKIFTYRCFPQINTKTARLEWWVDRELHQKVLGVVPYPSMDIDDKL